MKKTLCVIAIAGIMSSLLTGCYDRREIDDLTYVIALGFDKGVSSNLRLTIQFAVPLNIGGSGSGGSGGGGGGGGGGSETVSTVTLECPSMWAGINMVNSFIGKQVNLSHAKVIVFSEELAKSGRMFDYVHGIFRGREFRPTIYLAVSRGPAEEYIKSVKPVQEADPAKYYELKFSAYKFNAFTTGSDLFTFYSDAITPSQQAVATLVGANKNKDEDDLTTDKSDAKEKGHEVPLEGDYKAGDLPRIGDVKGETMGMAVFDAGKFVGEMDGQDVSCYLMVTGKYNHSYATIPDPKVKGTYVLVNIKQSRKPVIKASIIDNKPVINVKIKLEGDFTAIQSGINYESDSERVIFEQEVEKVLKEGIMRFIDRTKQYNSDICGFGRYLKASFLTWEQWLNYGWLGKYKDSTVNIDVDFKIRRSGLLIRSAPIIGSSGEVTNKE